jgi:UDP-2,4-diacetamido-2,4,6-trideoxy-beta-L-altropyranose hydrolase
MLALAQEARDASVEVRLVCSALPSGLEAQAEEAEVPVESLEFQKGSPPDAEALASLTSRGQPASVVVDGYHFTPSYYERIGKEAAMVAAVDDVGHQRFPVDVLVNVNPGADRIAYDVPSRCRLLLGLDYALLRPQFRERRRQVESRGGRRIPETVSKILVFLGGGDPTNETGKALRAIRRAGYTGSVDVLVGPANPHRSAIRSETENLDGTVRILSNVTRMAPLIDQQDLAVCAAGSTSWELACLGVPMLQMVVADNQERIAEELSVRGVTEFAGRREGVDVDDLARSISALVQDPQRRSDMSRRGWELVDGEGALRVLDVLRER